MAILMAKGGAPAPAPDPLSPPELAKTALELVTAAERMTPLEGLAPKPCSLTGHQFIRLYPDVLSRDACAHFLKLYDENANKRRGLTGGGGYAPKVKRCSEIEVGPLTGTGTADRTLHACIGQALRRYQEDVPSFAGFMRRNKVRDTGYLLQVYDEAPEGTEFENGGQGFGWHCDAFNKPSSERVLALIIYLNDVEVGGETVFSAWGLKVRPRAGMALWFPPGFDYEHAGLTPHSSRKAIITSFIVYQ
jgi:hypothetical protein